MLRRISGELISRGLPRQSEVRFPEKEKRTAGLRVGTAVGEPTEQVARPLLGDRRWVSGEEIVSATVTKAKFVPRKNRDESCTAPLIFFSFCDPR